MRSSERTGAQIVNAQTAVKSRKTISKGTNGEEAKGYLVIADVTSQATEPNLEK